MKGRGKARLGRRHLCRFAPITVVRAYSLRVFFRHLVPQASFFILCVSLFVVVGTLGLRYLSCLRDLFGAIRLFGVSRRAPSFV